LEKKIIRPHLKVPLVRKCPQWTNLSPWLRTYFAESLLLVWNPT